MIFILESLSPKQNSRWGLCLSKHKVIIKSQNFVGKLVHQGVEDRSSWIERGKENSSIVFCWPFILYCAFTIESPPSYTMCRDIRSGWKRPESPSLSEQLTWLAQFLPCCSPSPTSAVFHSINYINGGLLSIKVCGYVCVFVFEKSLGRQTPNSSKSDCTIKETTSLLLMVVS